MDTRNGNIVSEDELKVLLAEEPAQRKQFIPVYRDLTAREKLDKKIKTYSPCGCGSGKKFKFCCYGKGGKR